MNNIQSWLSSPTPETLADTPLNTWSNTILWRLCVALGYADFGDGQITVDPDIILDETLETIWKYRELLK